MNLKYNTLIFLIGFSCQFLSAQKDFRDGFIITLESDTIFGEIDYRFNNQNYNNCRFKSRDRIQEFTPSDIKGYGYINDKYFSSEILDESFVEVLVNGVMSLYKHKNNYLLKKDEEELFTLTSKEKIIIEGMRTTKKDTRWIGILTYVMNDCLSKSNKQLDKISFTERKLTGIVMDYNKCRGVNFKVYKQSKKWTKINFGLSVSITNSRINVDQSVSFPARLPDHYSNTVISPGFIFSISSPRLFDNLAFQVELHYLRMVDTKLVEISDPHQTVYHDTYINIKKLSLPLSVKYTFLRNKLDLFVQAGFNLIYNLDSETKYLNETVILDVVNTFPESTAFEVNKNQFGYFGGFGFVKNFKLFNAGIMLRYFTAPRFNQSRAFNINSSQLSVSVIILY